MRLGVPSDKLRCNDSRFLIAGGANLLDGFVFPVVVIKQNIESMAAIALAVASGGGAVKASKTTALMTGTQGVEVLKTEQGHSLAAARRGSRGPSECDLGTLNSALRQLTHC
jgi:hypothetical protein